MSPKFKRNSLVITTAIICLSITGYFIARQGLTKTSLTIDSKKPASLLTSETSKDSESNTTKSSIKNDAIKESKNSRPVSKDSTPWKNYINQRLNISFQYPNEWIKQGEESNIINRNGEVMSIKLDFVDTLSQSTLLIDYHLPPYGADLFKVEQEQFNSSQDTFLKKTKQVEIAGSKGIEFVYTMSTNIKGNIYNPPLKFVRLVFLDKQSGEFNLVFRTPLHNSESEIARLYDLLSTLKFIN